MTMRFLRLAPIFAAALLVGTAHAATGAPAAPTGLNGFMLQVNEPETTPPNTFQRTPSFAWNPVPGAIGYQFQISTSSTFRDNGTVYNTNTLATPVAAPAIVLPWITGYPHSLYARVRATTADGISPWSNAYGFDMLPSPTPPTPLPSKPGLLRWTTVPGATGYEVWLIDVTTGAKQDETGKKEFVRTNVLDEREFYTFHQSSQWIGNVRWRVRGLRSSIPGARNGLPVVSYADWSPIYSSSNTAPASGKISLGLAISDVVSDGTSNPSHELMPGFTWTGNQSLSGAPAELFRVYIFTDKLCLNVVYTSAVVGSPAYAPRPFGPLSLPEDPSAIANARSAYLPDGTESGGEMYDGTAVTPQEQLPAATPTTTAPTDDDAAGPPSSSAPAPAPAPAPADPSSSAAASAPASGSASAALGAPVDLWDTYNTGSGYYWTVVPVSTSSGASGSSTIASPGASKGSTLVPVTDAKQFAVGESITIGVSPNTDTATITAIGSSLLTINTALGNGHSAGDPIKTTTSNGVVYRDLDIPQDACKAGRISHFGIASEATVSSAQAPFATGLSADGRLLSASRATALYGRPLVAWTPALAAQNYEVEWSAKPYPFVSLGNVMTTSTSAVLPLAPGTWYYRVRGFDYSLATGSQQMAWFDPPEKLVIATPRFQVAKTTVKKKKFKVVTPTTKTVIIKLRPSGVTGSVQHESPPAGRSKGDIVVLTEQLSNLIAQFGQAAGSLVGTDRLTLTFTSPSDATVQATAVLPGGTILFGGHWNLANAISLTVSGGTGTFAQARGTFTETQSNSAVSTFTLTLLAP
jgi:hypothetical protein